MDLRNNALARSCAKWLEFWLSSDQMADRVMEKLGTGEGMILIKKFICIALILICILIVITMIEVHSTQTKDSVFAALVLESDRGTVSDWPESRSEMFPVYGYESEVSGDWSIALIDEEEIFFITLETEETAELVLKRSVSEYGERENVKGTLAVLGSDLIYYPGTNPLIMSFIDEIAIKKAQY